MTRTVTIVAIACLAAATPTVGMPAGAQEELEEISDYDDFSSVEDDIVGSWEEIAPTDETFLNPLSHVPCSASTTTGGITVRGQYTFFWADEGFAVIEQTAASDFFGGGMNPVTVLTYETLVVPEGIRVTDTDGPMANMILAPFTDQNYPGRTLLEISDGKPDSEVRYFASCE